MVWTPQCLPHQLNTPKILEPNLFGFAAVFGVVNREFGDDYVK
jgi:hypothetical protein